MRHVVGVRASEGMISKSLCWLHPRPSLALLLTTPLIYFTHNQTKVQVDVGLHEGLLTQYAILHEEVAPRFRRALDDVHDGLELMIGLGALGVGLYTASRLLRATYWALDRRAEKSMRWWKQVVALGLGAVVVGGVCTLGVVMTRATMLKERRGEGGQRR